ncbi:ABC transporter family substrate-binding protein [Actinobacteria bacterium YIM 96077]|uniref:ABC transporter family substrate-binding protein n=1 Tax=Phytoactinopolyspora halophila TaxID=1981511 RepID=A0A329QU94_9ACTN|nr:ABC transporter family substrate-binding protein [Phytoactinopolyspora halophila]AYY14329.1 ABC transporter family substrate-binding protein [Actinobacteria bacterium YIM 96077]RAW14872.1 ABC transporter family substrate-binding protein [Phytoactinopolyspora halophila]
MRTKRRGAAFLAATAAGALVLAACGDDADDSADDPVEDEEAADAPEDVEIVYAAEQEFASYNNNTADQNSFRNTHVVNGVLGGFWQYGPDGLAEPNEDFGTMELVSEDPQVVEYSFHEEAAWSDGTPLDCDDMLLYWAAQSGTYVTDEEDEEGNPVPLFSTAGTTGVEDWVKPDCEPGDKTITVEYETPYASWEALGGYGAFMPAHIVAEQGDLSEEEFIQAIRDDDMDTLADAAEFYNTGWTMDPGDLLDEELIPSSGPYKLTNWEAGESLTMEYNEEYWGDPPRSSTIVFRFLSQEQQAQALDNREVDIMDPQPNPDLVNQLDAMSGVELHTGESFTYEHVDFNMRPGHMFEDRELREAFAKCVPRELIVDNLIRPQNPDAEVLNARLTYSFQDDYDFQIEGSGYEDYMEVDIEGAREILEDKDMVGQEVRIGYQEPNPTRTNQVELIRDSCEEAGWEVEDFGTDEFFGRHLPEGNYDVALFGWIGSAYVSGTASTFMTPESCGFGTTGNNFGCYSNEEVDALYNELLTELDLEAQRPIVKEIEALLWEDLYTIPLFTHPDLLAWAEDVEGVGPNPSQGGITWNKHEWGRL